MMMSKFIPYVSLIYPGGSVSSVSWDHFFSSLNHYYTSLRQEAPIMPHAAADMSMSHVYRGVGGFGHHPIAASAARQGISAAEVDGLCAWLKVTQTVAEHDEGECMEGWLGLALGLHGYWYEFYYCT